MKPFTEAINEIKLKGKHRNIASSIRKQAKLTGMRVSIRRVGRDRYEVYLDGAKVIGAGGFHFKDGRWHYTDGVAPFETDATRRVKGFIQTAIVRCLAASEYRLSGGVA